MTNFFPLHRQKDAMDCGPSCLQMITQYYGKYFPLPFLREKCAINREGVSLLGIAHGAEQIGMRTVAVKIPFNSSHNSPCLRNAPLPLIAHWNQNHFIVVYKIDTRWVWIADPAQGKQKLKYNDFSRFWLGKKDLGIALLLQPTPSFFDSTTTEKSTLNFQFVFNYLRPHKKLLFQLGLGFIVASVLQLIFPFLTQAIVDIGIYNKNIQFVGAILLAQAALFLGQTITRFIQSWILLQVGTRLGISMLSDFLKKLMNLPLAFFEAKMVGDVLQRTEDHKRIEFFLMQSALPMLFAVINIFIFAGVLTIYSIHILLVFSLSSLLYFIWIFLFLKKRKEMDYLSFHQLGENQSSLIEIIQGMPEIKLQNSHRKRRWKWENIQAQLFGIQMKSLALAQFQEAGAFVINQSKDILITFIAASQVIAGEMSLGMMIAIQYIVGQINGSLQQFIGFALSAQDAKISIERLNEIHNETEEEPLHLNRTTNVPTTGNLSFENVSFSYSPLSSPVIQNIHLDIPRGKVTAIVGASGSGKTTLVKLLLGYYKPTKGRIKIGNIPMESINIQAWRSKCGAVLQDGYIFSDTIENNIAESSEALDQEQLQKAIYIANLDDFISMLPSGKQTMIGNKGSGVSQGQKQRILIARAVYKDPEVLFFDEATNALDSNNETDIMEKLQHFYKGKTVIVVAHRLSTVKRSDQIIVLENGCIIEQGDHNRLISLEGFYYSLVKNQIENI